MIEVSTALGLSVFMSALSVAAALFLVDRYERIDLSLPFGPAIPYTIAVIGGGIFYLAEFGVIGLMQALAGAIFFAAIVKGTKRLDTD
jgi:predicted membrane metal-binding protein